jgi:uncharacterized protein (TIGR02246 family)
VNEAEDPITRVVNAYKAAVFAKDVSAFVALYDQDVRVFDMWGQWSYTGVEAWRGIVTEWFGSLGAATVIVDVDDVQTLVAGEVAVVHALVRYKNVSASGEEARAMLNRLTWVLRQKHGAWKIVHEHTSAPVDFETSKVILQR